MVRLVSLALLVIALPAVARGNPPTPAADQARTFHLPRSTDHRSFALDRPYGQAEIAPNTHFGVGMFGLRSEKSHLRPVTGREIDVPKQRRAAVGFSLKF